MVQRRNTQQRKMVLEAVQALHCHPTAAQVYEFVREQDPKVSLGTVYRNLNLLAEQGEILAVKTADGCHFDYRLDDHSHVVCMNCGCVEDAEVNPDASLDERIAKASGFTITSHYTVFEGLCPTCQN